MVFSGDAFHFYELRASGTAHGDIVDMQRIDVGIALCHFHLAALEQGLPGHLLREEPDIARPKEAQYVASWALS